MYCQKLTILLPDRKPSGVPAFATETRQDIPALLARMREERLKRQLSPNGEDTQ